jgi:hypothetical protein
MQVINKPHEYFTAEETSLTISTGGALAIFAGDSPRHNADGSTNHALRAPLLLMPQEMWSGQDELMAKIAKVLNDNAHVFFDSANRSTGQREEDQDGQAEIY